MLRRAVVLLLFMAGLPATARAGIDVSIGTPGWVYTSYDMSGDVVPNNITYTVGGGSIPHVDVHDDNMPFWTAVDSFDVPSSGFELNILVFGADDRAVLELNGTIVDAVGTYGPAESSFNFYPTQPAIPQFFNSQYSSDTIISGIKPSNNQIEVIINNTGDGVYAPNGLTGGPTGLTFIASVSPVPEPTAVTLFASALAMLIALGRTRERSDVEAAPRHASRPLSLPRWLRAQPR